MPLDRIAMPKFSKYDHICECVQCGKSFTPKTKNQKFCSTECRKSEEKERGISCLNNWFPDSENKGNWAIGKSGFSIIVVNNASNSANRSLIFWAEKRLVLY